MSIQISLHGIWNFRLDKEKKGLDSHYELQDFTDTIQLPTTVSQAKKGTPHSKTETGFLTDPYEMFGYSWYQKTIALPFSDISDIKDKQFELTLERTRISHVWVDGVFVGSCDSFIIRHSYDLTDFIQTLRPVITIMVSNTDYKVPGGHLTSPDTQTNWNGILGEISLIIREDVKLGPIYAQCDFAEKSFHLHIPVHYASSVSGPAQIQVLPVLCHLKDVYAEADKNIPDDASFEELIETQALTDGIGYYDVILEPGENQFDLLLNLSESFRLWDEENPYVYRLDFAVSTTKNNSASRDTTSVFTGLRSFISDGTNFCINGRKTFLRGKHEGMIFPKTGYAPMTLSGWLHVMKISRDFGINHYRFHTCCPPEAAFTAADLLGIYMQPELPFWGTFNGSGDEGYQEEAQNFLEAEGFRMLENYSNHPSYCMMSMGNELWGNASALNELLGKYKSFRPHVLFTQGSNNFQWVPNIQSNDDFFSGVRFTLDRQIRGSYAMCDKPQGHIQTAAPDTYFNYDEAIRPSYESAAAEISSDGTVEIQYGTGVKRVKLTEAQSELIPNIPVVSHEIGQYETFPDFSEIAKYTGVLKPRNFIEFKNRLEAKGMLEQAHDFFVNSGALAVACYKSELETALRSSYLAGFQILDIQDFSGQGTALVGVLNAFMENKGLISASDWRKFCSDAVLQAEFDSFIVTFGQTFSFAASLSYFCRKSLPECKLICRLTDEDNVIFDTKSALIPSVTENGRHILGNFEIPIPLLKAPASFRLSIELEGTGIENSYKLWAYPSLSSQITSGIRFEESADHFSSFCKDWPEVCRPAFRYDELPALAQHQKSCLLFLSKEENMSSIEGTYCTDFWCYPMFRNISLSMNKEVPVGTMGLLIHKEHEALKDFPCESYTTPQWYSIVTASRSTILDDTTILPIVQTIDNFDRNHRLGLLYEIYLSDLDLGVLVCTSDLPKLIQDGHPEAEALYNSLVSYLPRLSITRAEKYSMSYDSFKALL